MSSRHPLHICPLFNELLSSMSSILTCVWQEGNGSYFTWIFENYETRKCWHQWELEDDYRHHVQTNRFLLAVRPPRSPSLSGPGPSHAWTIKGTWLQLQPGTDFTVLHQAMLVLTRSQKLGSENLLWDQNVAISQPQVAVWVTDLNLNT